MTHPFINPTPLRAHLSAQLARLVRVIEGSDQEWRVSEATRHAAKLRRWIECETDVALTLKPVPQVDLQVEDICRHMEPEANWFRAVPHQGLGYLIEDAA